ncbi:MAG TPA: hypothetical protein VFE50_20845 [Cyclobacteriaceae bacterium]|nr:hypothetical protein [Cyclobacteriaceae bacterium]
MKKISNLHDLMAEKQRLKQKLDLLKRDMNSEVTEIKEKVTPILRIIGFLTGGGVAAAAVNGTHKTSLLKAGANLGVDLLVGSKLKKAGWLAKMIVPPLLRGISSTVINRFKK